jgi:hypothetical protein
MGQPLLALLAAVLLACGGRCPEIAAARRALERTAIAPGPHVEVRIPLDRSAAARSRPAPFAPPSPATSSRSSCA